jgi:hypothetical protein
LDTVVEGVTGTFFRDQTPESLIEAILRIDRADFDSAAIRAHAQQFDVEVFRVMVRSYVQEQMRI